MKGKGALRIAILSIVVVGASPGCQAQGETTSELVLALSGSSLGMVVNNTTGGATVFNADTNTILGTIPGLGTPGSATGDCSITSDGRKAFFTRGNSNVTVVDLTGASPTFAGPPNPIGIANSGGDIVLSPDGKFLLVCDTGRIAPISVIDVATQTEISTFNTGADCNSIDVCSDGSVLITSFNTDRVRRLSLSSSGALTDTGQALGVSNPVNVYCSPAATAGVVVTFDSDATSFQLPELTQVSTRGLDSFGVSGAFSHAGDRVYFRTSNGAVTSFTFDQATGSLGASPTFHTTVSAANTFFGVDQLAVHPSGASIYVSGLGAVNILDATSGAPLGALVDLSIRAGTGICFGARGANKPPVATCADRTVPADGTCHGLASIDDGSFDPDSGDTIQCTQIPSGPFDHGATPVTLTCTDSHGTSSSCTATVTVVDQTAPDLACPADRALECNDGHGGATASFTATAIDGCDPAPTVACVPASGSTFSLGRTGDECSAVDASGNVSRCSHNVTVVDTVPPVVVTKDVAELWPPNHKYHRIELDDCIASIQDLCEGPLDIASHAQITCCTSDEPDDGTGDDDVAGDCVIIDSHSVDVRAERIGNSNGRVYTIHYTATDSSNATEHTCKVGVPHSRNGNPAVDDSAQAACR
jgi:sugar lactone lactonase YvrE